MKILLADDHNLFREAMAEWLKRLHERVIIDHAGSLEETVQLLDKEQAYRLLLLDLHMPGMDGIASVQKICTLAAPASTVVVSADESPATINRCLETGISGYLPKSLSGEVVLEAIQSILQGRSYRPEMMLNGTNWSKKKLKLLACLAKGMTNREIASTLHLSEGTVKQYVSRMLTKLDVNNRTQAGIKARDILGFSSI